MLLTSRAPMVVCGSGMFSVRPMSVMVGETMRAKEIALGGLKAGGVVAAANIPILIALKIAGFDEYPNDMRTGVVMDFGQFTSMMILTCLLVGAVGAFLWMWMHEKWGDTAWKQFGAMALVIATVETLYTCGFLTESATGSQEARIIVGVLHYTTALLGGFWLIPHYSSTGCTCDMCPICNKAAESTD